MEPINKTLKKLASSPKFQQTYNQMKDEILADDDVQRFLKEHSARISPPTVEKGLMKLYEYTSQEKQCQGCPSLEDCENMMPGFEPELFMRGEVIDINYRACPRKIVHDERSKMEKLIQSIYVPKDILHATFSSIDLDTPTRLRAAKAAKDFVESYSSQKNGKGLYFYGKFGVGKSYLLGAIANELAEKQISSLIVYIPEFFREMKQSLQDQSVNEKLKKIKSAPILMLDDIGAESMSSWARDDILGTILQYRMLENLPTFFSSNFDFEGLKHHLTYSQRGEEEKMKAARIMERIKYLATPVNLDGPNRREL
ncbi:primosomal protein DnaI [Bacillus sp. 2205SS5-2]|uniref:primosomal protein DnaI n=1 Tax=Bacillus sp. 2205SS5-2 TaxID=3109031 RepID=UPI003006B169